MRAKLIGTALVLLSAAGALAVWNASGTAPSSAEAQDDCLDPSTTIVAVEDDTTLRTNSNDTVCSRRGESIGGDTEPEKVRPGQGDDIATGGSENEASTAGPTPDPCRAAGESDSLGPCADGDGDGAVFYVATDGSDTYAGTKARPWASLQYGADQLEPGDTLYVRAGVYDQLLDIRVSGAKGALIKIRNYPGETPVIDGSGSTKPDGWAPLIRIHNQSYVRIRGFEIRGQQSDLSTVVPIGILVDGSGRNIELVKNVVHNIETNATGDRNAHGIAVYGTAEEPLRNILIDSNRVEQLVLGSSEAIVLNGNVDGFTVSNNLVRNNDNIGIDIIGFEGTAPTVELDRARNGVVRNNEVYGIDAGPNPSYSNPSAVGIYVDGGLNVIVENNIVSDSNIGIEIASEDPSGNASGIIVRNNVVYANHIAGLLVGGFDTERGFAADCSVTNNTFFGNDTLALGNGEVVLQSDVRNCEFLRNIIVAADQGVLVSNIFTDGSGNRFDDNLYFTSGNPEWEWSSETFSTLPSWRQETGNDSTSQFADPLFVNPAVPNVALRAGSPALGAGSQGERLGADMALVGRG